MKKLVLALALVFGLVVPSQAAITFVNQVGVGSVAGDTITTAAVDMTGANFLVVSSAYYVTGGTATITDSSSNSWSCLIVHEAASFGAGHRICYVANATVTSSQTFTATCTQCFPSLVAMGFAGVKVSSPFDQQNGATTASGTSLATGSITPAENNELIIAGFSFDVINTVTISASFSTVYQVNFGASAHYGAAGAYKIQTTAEAVNPSFQWGSTAEGAASIASFKAEAVAASGSSLSMMGVGR